jgi:sulfoxide reductase catalytic subunit YedY
MLGVFRNTNECHLPGVAMLIKSPKPSEIVLASDITPQAVYESRRAFIAKMAAGAVAGGALWEMANREAFAQPAAQKLAAKRNSAYAILETATPFKDATTYNNFYEFGLDKDEPAKNAGRLKTRPWTVQIDGEVKKPMTLDIDSLL